MKTTSNNPIYVSFHIGRGGHSNNPGFLTFQGEEDFQQLIERCADCLMLDDEDSDGNPLPDDKWQLVDNGGNIILEGRDEIEAPTGYLEFDGIYNTDYVTTVDAGLSDREKAAIWKAYTEEAYMSEALKSEICRQMGLARAEHITKRPTSLEIEQQHIVATIDLDQQAGMFTRDEWREILDNYDPISIEEILLAMESYGTNTTEFFEEDN